MSVRNTVFISHSCRDLTWVERVLTFLKPYTRTGKLTVWADPYIQTGDDWRREIENVLEQTAVGLLLVTPDFIASDFIHQVELPRLVTAADAGLLTLLCVPISASIISETRLSEFEWVRPAARPLDLLSEPERNAELVKLVKTVVGAVGRRSPAASERPQAGPVRRGAVPAAPRGRSELGELHDVPAPPPHYLPRSDDLERLRHALLDGRSGAVGITGEPYRMGLHGQGGIGKSVLAAALARDESVRRAFPGGVFWVTVGQAPDLPRIQAKVLKAADAETASVTDAEQGRKALEARFRDDAVLLVLDDAWDFRHAWMFDVLGPNSRLVVTTRDAALLTALGVEKQTVQCLPEGAALALLASWAGSDATSASSAARGIARECGYLPLALSLAGAKVRDGTPWHVVLKALEHGHVEFLDHPYSSVFRSMRLSVDALAPDERERYLELAVFPEDERVPESVVLALWKRTAGLDEFAGQNLLTGFQGKALLDVASADGRLTLALHDLQHDFLRISARDLPWLHTELLTALAACLSAFDGRVEWWRLPMGAHYAWIHLATHLIAAGRAEELCDLLFDCRWLEAKLRAAGLRAVLSDFGALPYNEELSLTSGALRLSEHVLGNDASQLRSQLTGRLLGSRGLRVIGLLSGAVTGGTGPWLRPTTPSLNTPAEGLLRTLVGHSGRVRALALTPDGRAVSGSYDHTLKVWNLENGEEELTLAGHAGEVLKVAVTSDGRWAVSMADDGTVKVWDLVTGSEDRTLGPVDWGNAMVLTQDGRRAVTGSPNGAVQLWDLTTGAMEYTPTAHEARILGMAVTPDGRRAVSGSTDHTLKVWDLATGAEEYTLLGHAREVRAVAVTPDGRRAVSGSGDGTLKVWDLATGAEEHTLHGHTNGVPAVAVTPDGRRVVSGSYDGTVKVWNLETGAEERTLAGHANWVMAVAVTLDGEHVVSSSDDGTLKVWTLAAGVEERAPAGHASRVSAVTIMRDGLRAVSGSSDGTLKVWALSTGTEERTMPSHAGMVATVVVTPDGQRAVSAHWDFTLANYVTGPERHSLKVWDLATGSVKHTLPGNAWCVAVTPDGRRVVSGMYDKMLKVWNLESGVEEHTLTGHGDIVGFVAITSEGRRAVSASHDGTLKVWDLKSGAEESTLAGDAHGVAITSDGRRLVSVSREGTVRVWDLEPGVKERTFTGLPDGLRSVAMAPDGRRAVFASLKGMLMVCNLETGEEEWAAAGHASDASIKAVAVTSDGCYVISASEDGTLKAWSLEGGRLLATFTADAPIWCCTVAPNGSRLVAGDAIGRVHFLVLDDREIHTHAAPVPMSAPQIIEGDAVLTNPGSPKEIGPASPEIIKAMPAQQPRGGGLPEKVRILFLGANSMHTPLDLERELSLIEDNLRLSREHDNLELKQVWAVTVDRLIRALLAETPTIVHFSGHGHVQGIVLRDAVGAEWTVPGEALAGLFELFKDTVRCVVLNACYSEAQARAIRRHIPYVIGIPSRIEDAAAIAFSTGFYQAIGARKDVPFAFHLGKQRVLLEGLAGGDLPILV